MLLKNTEGKYFTLSEYAALVKENQTDKNGNVIYLYTNDPVSQNSFVGAARDKGYDVLVMDGQLDTHFIGWFENKNQGTRFVRVDADVVDKAIEKENNLKMALSSAQQDLLRPVFEAQLPAEDKIRYTVSFEPMAENQMPVMITQNEFMRRMKDMAAMGGSGMQFYGQLPDNFNVVINGNHPLVAEILGEVEASYGDKGSRRPIKSWMRRSPSSAVSKSWSKTRRRKIFRRKKKTSNRRSIRRWKTCAASVPSA